MKFNLKAKAATTQNHEGEKAFVLTPEIELYALAVTSVLSDTFYTSAAEQVNRLRELISKCRPEFVAKLAIYTREQMYLRSIPLVLTVELAKTHSGDDLVSRLTERVVQRADEITELLAYYEIANGRTDKHELTTEQKEEATTAVPVRKQAKTLNRLSKQIQKGLAAAFNKFDEYQFSKYNRAGSIKLRDALFLVHPKAKDENQQAIFNRIATNSLQTAYTWETELSKIGQQKFADPEAKALAFRHKWEELIASNKMGYMALLRNLRNFLEAGVSTNLIEKVAQQLADSKEVQASKQLPFRFLAAYRELKAVDSPNTAMLLEALENAVKASVENLRGFNSQSAVLVACDVSGSMQQAISARSKVEWYDIGLMLGMLLQHKCQRVSTGIFGDSWKVINLPKSQILSNADELHRREGEVGYSTNGYLVIKYLVERKEVYNKVMIFTDCQLWNSNATGETIEKYWNQYVNLVPNAQLYLFDLAGYGTTPLNILRPDVFLIAGWSDKVFEVLEAVESGTNAVAFIEEKIQL
jgi:hypothetical protein